MVNEELFKKINCIANDNVNYYNKNYLRDLLVEAEKSLKEMMEAPGAEDAWKLARKIEVPETRGGYSMTELEEIFGYSTPFLVIGKNTTYKEALAKVEAYEKKKKEEAEKPVIGDVVVCRAEIGAISSEFKGIFYGETSSNYYILTKSNKCPQIIEKSTWVLIKTGKHFDIQGMLDEL